MIHPNTNFVYFNLRTGCTISNLVFIIWLFETQIYYNLNLFQLFNSDWIIFYKNRFYFKIFVEKNASIYSQESTAYPFLLYSFCFLSVSSSQSLVYFFASVVFVLEIFYFSFLLHFSFSLLLFSSSLCYLEFYRFSFLCLLLSHVYNK